MKFWILQDGEPLPGIDKNVRDWRAALLSKALVNRGHEVLWWASTFDHIHKRYRFNLPQTIQLEQNFAVRLLHGPGYRHNKSPRRFWHQSRLAAAFAREAVYCDPPDLVFCSVPTLELAEQSLRYSRQRHLPVIVDIRDAWPDHYLSIAPGKLRKLVRLLLFMEFQRARRIFRGMTGISTISETYLTWGLRYADRSRCTNDGVFSMGYPAPPQISTDALLQIQADLTTLYELRNKQLVLTFVGTLSTAFDLTTIVAAAYRLSQSKYADIQFIIVGEGEQKTSLQRQAGYLTNITFTGWFDQNSVNAVLGLSSVGLAPYKSDSIISLPNKPFEYMAMGLPLLSSLPGELAQLIDKHSVGIQYSEGDVDALVQKIIWFAEHPEERTNMGQRSRQLFDKCFRADIIYPQLAMHLENIVNQGINSPN